MAIVSWQTSTLAIVTLVIGLPLGVAIGRWGWAFFANWVGVDGSSATPLWMILLTIPALLVVANGVSLVPAWRSACCHTGNELRPTE